MSLKSFCDICDKEIVKDEHQVRTWGRVIKTYCESCWEDEKNWKTIHSPTPRKSV